MSKHIITEKQDGPNWRLPSETDLADLSDAVKHGIDEGTAVEIEVELNDNPLGRGSLILNGRSLTQVAIIEVPESHQ